MKGWKTWFGGGGLIVYGIFQIITGEVSTGVESILAGLGIVGIGHKIVKTEAIIKEK
jgi:hypothetical protein